MATRSSRAPRRPPGRPWALLLGGLVVALAVWLAGGLAAAAGWPLWARWLVAALVWPIAPLALLVLVSPRLGLRRASVAIALVEAGACALWWRRGVVAAVTVHAAWMVPGADEAAAPPSTPREAPDEPRDAQAPSEPQLPRDATPPETPPPAPPRADEAPEAPTAAPPGPRDPPASRCFRAVVTSDRSGDVYGARHGDLDGDGVGDVVAIESARSDAIRTWKGDREGRFHAAGAHPYEGGGLGLALLDADGDGLLDVATADHERATVTLWRGAGDGTFTRGASHRTYRSPLGIVAADVDADGRADLVVTHYFHVEVMRGGPGGALRTTPWLRLRKDPEDPSRLLTPEDVAAVDLTGDGLLDLVIPKGDARSLEVWLGRGRGTFRRAADVESCPAPAHTLVGDVVEDGALDVIVRCGRRHLELFVGDGAGGLTRRGPLMAGDVDDRGALVDLTGDGHLDLIAPTIPGPLGPGRRPPRDSPIVVLAGDGAGGFTEIDRLPLAGLQHRILAVVDVDGDGPLDVVYECYAESPGSHLGVAFGAGCGAPREGAAYRAVGAAGGPSSPSASSGHPSPPS